MIRVFQKYLPHQILCVMVLHICASINIKEIHRIMICCAMYIIFKGIPQIIYYPSIVRNPVIICTFNLYKGFKNINQFHIDRIVIFFYILDKLNIIIFIKYFHFCRHFRLQLPVFFTPLAYFAVYFCFILINGRYFKMT